MSLEVRVVDPKKEDLRFLDGPWRNDACVGYAMMAMRRTGVDDDTIQKVVHQMRWCFDDTTVEEAAAYFIKKGVNL